MGVNLLAVSERKDLLAIELQRSCGFMGTVNVAFAGKGTLQKNHIKNPSDEDKKTGLQKQW